MFDESTRDPFVTREHCSRLCCSQPDWACATSSLARASLNDVTSSLAGRRPASSARSSRSAPRARSHRRAPSPPRRLGGRPAAAPSLLRRVVISTACDIRLFGETCCAEPNAAAGGHDVAAAAPRARRDDLDSRDAAPASAPGAARCDRSARPNCEPSRSSGGPPPPSLPPPSRRRRRLRGGGIDVVERRIIVTIRDARPKRVARSAAGHRQRRGAVRERVAADPNDPPALDVLGVLGDSSAARTAAGGAGGIAGDARRRPAGRRLRGPTWAAARAAAARAAAARAVAPPPSGARKPSSSARAPG